MRDGILVLDFGGQDAQAVARKVRGEHVYSQVLPFDADIERIRACEPRGLILTGGRGDPFGAGALDCAGEVYALGLPMLGFGYGASIMLRHAGARLVNTQDQARACQVFFEEHPLFEGLTQSERMLDRLDEMDLPEGFERIAYTAEGEGAAFACEQSRMYGMQFYTEPNDPDGLAILDNYCKMCGCARDWSMESFLEEALEQIKREVGAGRALIAISGGVDSAVCAALMHRAIGQQLTCMHVDTGLMRKGEREAVESCFGGEMGMNLVIIDARARFLKRLRGIEQADEKRRAVEDEYINVLKEEIARSGGAEILAQGTIYTDILSGEEMGAREKGAALSENVDFVRLIEPIKMLFKDEVRELGRLLGLSQNLVNRQAFPAAGLAMRCRGEVTRERLDMVREADAILREEIVQSGLEKRVRQYFVVLTTERTSGVPESGYAAVLRVLSTTSSQAASVYRLPYDLLERLAARITAEVQGINRVVYDITGMPPATVEWD